MSIIYKRKLARIQDERDTAAETVAYVRDNWYTKSLFNEAIFKGGTHTRLYQLAENLDTIFTIRLFAAFEGMLQEHMQQHHPGTHIPEYAGASYLIDTVATAQTIRISIALCDEVHEVRQYRNSLMHPAGKSALEIPFTAALARLARYVGWLPEPK